MYNNNTLVDVQENKKGKNSLRLIAYDDDAKTIDETEFLLLFSACLSRRL